jgi:hypothetical protein
MSWISLAAGVPKPIDSGWHALMVAAGAYKKRAAALMLPPHRGEEDSAEGGA